MIVDLVLRVTYQGGAGVPDGMAGVGKTKPSSSVMLDMRLKEPNVKMELNRSV
jgi:hypothetical protein